MTPAPGITASPGSAPADLLAELRDRGVAVRVQADNLVLDAPAGAITPAMANRLKAHKVELLEALNTPTDTPTPNPILSAAGIAPGDLSLLDDFREVFSDAEVIEAVAVDDDGAELSPAELAEQIIGITDDPSRAQDLRDQWEERLAICTVDGGLSEPEAEAVALVELRRTA